MITQGDHTDLISMGRNTIPLKEEWCVNFPIAKEIQQDGAICTRAHYESERQKVGS